VVDMENGAGIDYDSSDMKDRLHPSQTGYDKMATHWYPVAVQAVAHQLWLQNGPPGIESISVQTNSILLGITNLVSGLSIGIETTPSLTPPVWSNISTLTASDISTNWADSADATAAFYRVVGE
jgi:hypothetical protein